MESTPKIGFYGRERRRAPRKAVHIPAYASLNGSSQSAPQELCEILNISNSGTCIQAPSQMKLHRLVPLVLDLSATGSRIHTAGHVVWAEASGRTGIRFPELPQISILQLEQWMVVNDAAGKVNPDHETGAEAVEKSASNGASSKSNSASSYTSLIAEWAEIQRDVELFGPNLDLALKLIAERALAMTWASGAAIALPAEHCTSDLICVARAGTDSPELGARLDTSSGFSGECLRSGTAIRCDDTEIDPRDENGSYRALGIRAVLACPIRAMKGELLGVIEVFSPEPAAFWDNDARSLERLARIAAKAVAQARHATGSPLPIVQVKQEVKTEQVEDLVTQSDIEILQAEGPQTTRNAALFAAGIMAVVLIVWFTAPWISNAMNSFISPPKSQAAETAPASSDYVGLPVDELRKIALQGSPTAQYSLGLRYATGEGIVQDYHEALGWFLKAAENGNFRAAGKIASCFWAGKGTQQDYGRAYFWGLLAQAVGDESGQVIVINSAPHLSDHQRRAEQQEADKWLHSHRSPSTRASR